MGVVEFPSSAALLTDQRLTLRSTCPMRHDDDHNPQPTPEAAWPPAAAQMRVLHVITRFAGGGSEQRLLDAVRAAGPHALSLVVVGQLDRPDRLAKAQGKVNVIELPELVRDPSPTRDPAAYRRVCREIEAFRPHVIHSHQAKSGVIARLAARRTGTPILHSASMATFGPGYSPLKSRLFEAIERSTDRFVDRYAVVGHDLARRLADSGIPRSKMTVVRSSLDLQPLIARRAGRRPPTDELSVLYIGSLEERKGINMLPDFAERLASLTGKQVHLRVAGEGPMASELSEAAAAASPAVTISMLGYRRDIPELLATSDLTVLLSSSEGIPQVLIQSAAAGVPFAAFHVDGVTELAASGAAGATAPIGDVAELVRQTGHLLDSPCPAAPEAYFEPWSATAVDRQYQQLYSELTGVPGRSGLEPVR